MFDRFTQEVRDDFVSAMTDSLAEGSGLIVSAVEGFYRRIAAGEDLADAYSLLEEELGTRGWGRTGSDDPRLEGLSPSWSISKALACVEAHRREDEFRNPFVPRTEEWTVAELFLDHVLGDPVALAALPQGRYGKLSGPAVSDIVVQIANGNLGRLAPAKTKVDGKVAYGLIVSDEKPIPYESGAERDRWYDPKAV